MKKFLPTAVAAATVILFTVASLLANDGHDDAAANATSSPSHGQKYTCPMHPDVVLNKPGRCPQCGMTLVPKKESQSGGK